MAEKHTSSLHGKKYRTLAELIDALDQQQGHQQALYALQREDVRVIERIELKKKIIDTAAALLQAGLEKGDRVVLWAGNSPEWIIACLAVIRAGGRIVPLDVQLDRSALERIIEDCAPRFIFTEKKRSRRLEELSCDIPRTLWIDKKNEGDESLWNLKGKVILPELTKDDGAVLFYTSGTTGPPKGVPLTHGNLAFQINRILAEGLNRDDDRLLLPLPLHHVYPFTVGLLFPLAAKMPIILPLSLTGPQIVRAVNKGDVSVICGVPRLYRALYDAIRERFASRGDRALRLFSKCLRTTSSIQLKTGWKAGKVLLYPLHRKIGSRLRLVASGGSPLDPNLARSLEGLGWQVVIGYGLTETSPLLTLNPPGTGRFESVGRAIEGVELRIDPSSGGDERNGEVLARGPNVFSGYYQLPEESKESLTEDGWFRTGDLGTIDDEGYLKLQGRVSSLIVTESGKNITPEEVEEAYERCPQVRETGILEDDGRLVALVVPEEGADEDDPKKMAEALSRTAEDLPSYWQLADIVLTPRSLPRTRLGKIRRHLLEERYQEAKSGKEEDPLKEPLPLSEMSGEDRDLLENSAARTTWDWLAGRYGDRGLTPDSRLQSDLGIDSLEWMTVTVEVGVRAGVELDEKTIAEIRTVRDLLQKVASEAEEKGEVFSGEPLESPMEVLNDQQKRWLSPPGWLMSHARGPLLSLNSFIIRHYFDLEISGLENIPEGPCVFAPNHQSSLDPLVLAAILPQDVLKKTWWGGWTGIAFGNPLMRAVSRVGKAVPVDPDHAAISSLAFGAAVLRREHNLTWFPEGQRSPDGELRPFKPGIGLLLDRYPTPVLPVVIEGTRELLPKGKLWPRRGTIMIHIGAPLDPRHLGSDSQDSRQSANAIASCLQNEVEAMQKRDSEEI